MPKDGPVSWTSHGDLAEAAAIALTEDVLDGTTPALTGAEAIDMTGVAALASELTGRTIRRVVVPDAEFRAGRSPTGSRRGRRTCSSSMFAASHQGEFAQVDPALGHLIGRPPVPLREVLAPAIP